MTIRGHDTPLPHTFPLRRRRSIQRPAAGHHSRYATSAVLLALALGGCGTDSSESPSETTSASAPSSDSEATAASESASEPEVVAQSLDAPWSVAFYKGSALVSERDSGRILELNDQRPAHTREVTTVTDVAASGEGGLLGLTVHDDDLYAYFTAEADNRIQRFPLSNGAEGIEVGEPETIVDGIDKAGIHNGGRLAVGPDGMLYATVGDAGNRSAAQDRQSLSGSILRMEPDGTVPEDNPFDDSLVYSYGHRNPQGLAWDEDETMYSSEFGQDTWDELNIIEPGGNYGWPEVEGIAEGPTGGGSTDNQDDFIDPVQQWRPDEASPSGIAVSDGSIVIANLRGEVLRKVPTADVSDAELAYAGEFGRLRDVVATPNGELWMVTNNTDGRGDPAADDDRILRIPSDLAVGD